jgi:hypothetical protein
LQQSGPNRIDVVDDGQPAGPPMPPFIPPRPHRHGPFVPPPIGLGYQSEPQWVPHGGPSYGPPRVGGTIEVNWGNRSRHTEMSIETVNELHAVLGRVLDSADLDESVRAALRNLREAFSAQETPGGS